MSTIASAHHGRAFHPAAALLALLRSVSHFMILLAEVSAQARGLNQISRMTDDDLTEKGLTREGEIRRILGAASVL